MKAVPEKPSETSRPGTPRTDASPRPALSPPDRRSLQRLQRMAGNGAVSRLVAQRYTAPVKPAPAQSPRFRGVKADVAAKKTRLAAHAPAAAESKASQDAAVAPPDDKEAQGKAANAEKMNAAKPGEFDKKAFIDAVNKAIDAQAPKNLDEADKFSGSGKADQVKAEVDGKVTDGKESSAKDIDTATKAPPDTSAAQDKDVTPLTPDRAPSPRRARRCGENSEKTRKATNAGIRKKPARRTGRRGSLDKRKLLREGVRAASKELDRHEGELVPESSVRVKLSTIKARYKLTELRAFEDGDSWRIEAAINPRASAKSKAPTKKQLMTSMRKSLGDYGPKRAQEIHREWGNQLGKSRIGGISIWDETSLKGTEEEALKDLQKNVTGRALIGYFKKTRGKDLAETDTFHKYALHETKTDPPHTVRADFIGAMSRGALIWITGKEGGEKRIKSIATDEDDAKVINKLPGIGFELKNYRYGRFTHLPNTGEEADANLVDAVAKCEGPPDKPIINFLKLIVKPGATVNGIDSTEFLKIWKKGGASTGWVKEQFRAARPGHHEWIPTNYIGRVLETAIESRDRDGIDTAVEWITLQHALRSFTGDVLWDMKIDSTTTAITRDNFAAHTGAYAENTYSSVADPIYHGDPKKRHLPQDPETRIPSGGLRGIFEAFLESPDQADKTARGFLSHLQALLESGKLMWDGEISPDFPEDVYTVPVMGTYKRKVVTIDTQTSVKTITTVEMVNIPVKELADKQKENYQRVLQDFFEARKALEGRGNAG
ncbi:hypothetical protein SCALM49S_04472 [Streptomyces californicus]